MKYFEISPIISNRLAVFPGDKKFSRSISYDFKTGAHLELSSIETTLHLGAHADSSSHYHADGEGVDRRDLNAFFGQAQVIEVKVARGARIYPQDIKTVISAQRVLLKTNSFPNPEDWNSDFNSLSPELVDFLAGKKVIMIGIDTPSVDPETSKKLESHQALYRNKISVLEGIVLDKVPEGHYQLVALPLAIEGGDASPVRAILIEGPQLFPKAKLTCNLSPQKVGIDHENGT